MLRFLAFCLLATPFVQGLSVPTDTAPSLTVIKDEHEFEKEVHENITHCTKQSSFVPYTHNNEGEHGPAHVKVSVNVLNIFEIKTVDTNVYDWTLDLILRQTWNDKRLTYDVTDHPDFKYIYLNTHEGQNSIWKPDTFFSHSIKEAFHYVTTTNAYVWVYPNGDVRYTNKITLTLRCYDVPKPETNKEDGAEKESDLVCPMKVASYGYADDKVVYEWDEGETVPAVKTGKDLYLPHFTLDKVTTESHISKTRIAGFSSLVAKFHFTHK